MLILVTALGFSKTCVPQSHVRASFYADAIKNSEIVLDPSELD